jgi:hypothetical protein
MAGTVEGGKKAAQRNKELYGEDFYKNLGKAGGKASGTGGFYYAMKNMPVDAPGHPRAAGKIGGAKSRRVAKNV